MKPSIKYTVLLVTTLLIAGALYYWANTNVENVDGEWKIVIEDTAVENMDEEEKLVVVDITSPKPLPTWKCETLESRECTKRIDCKEELDLTKPTSVFEIDVIMTTYPISCKTWEDDEKVECITQGYRRVTSKTKSPLKKCQKSWYTVSPNNELRYKWKVLEGKDPKKFAFLSTDWSSTYAIVDGEIYYYGEPVQGSDIASYVILKNWSANVDKNNLYYNGKKVEGVDMNSFSFIGGYSVVGGNSVGIDKSNIYRNGIIVDKEAISTGKWEHRYNEKFTYATKNGKQITTTPKEYIANYDRLIKKDLIADYMRDSEWMTSNRLIQEYLKTINQNSAE